MGNRLTARAVMKFTQEIGRGGEGVVYETDRRDGQVCKVLDQSRRPRSTIEKLKLMIERQVEHPAICWPTELVEIGGETVGYLMPRASGKELQRTIFIRPLFEKVHSDWTRIHLVHLTRAILKAVQHLHAKGVLLGDVSAQNVMVQDEFNIFLVDCDSFQIGPFACGVGTPPYLAPELYGTDLKLNLRTIEHELFAVATLVFMIFHPGKAPYSHRGGGDPAKNVLERHFPYPLGEHSQGRAPAGQWRYCWSHLPYFMKETFHAAFGRDALPSRRPTIDQWIKHMDRYEVHLTKGHVSDEIFPEDFKQLSEEQRTRHGVSVKARPATVQREARALGYISSIPIGGDFGFIESDSDGEELFFHQNSVVGRDFRHLQPGDRVQYTPGRNPRDGRPVATYVLSVAKP